ncbi:hypothetical protein ACTFQD_02720 [Aliivibrio fischeri]|uniref:hypothetical protein n=1 Tax=Aliivibrio fischeri TaxID=668 RepID=UPI003F75DAF8
MSRTYPPEWDRFCELNTQYPNFTLFNMDPNTVIADVNRFSARYRMIKDLDKVKVSGATDITEDGYTALLRILFVWGAADRDCIQTLRCGYQYTAQPLCYSL